MHIFFLNIKGTLKQWNKKQKYSNNWCQMEFYPDLRLLGDCTHNITQSLFQPQIFLSITRWKPVVQYLALCTA